MAALPRLREASAGGRGPAPLSFGPSPSPPPCALECAPHSALPRFAKLCEAVCYLALRCRRRVALFVGTGNVARLRGEARLVCSVTFALSPLLCALLLLLRVHVLRMPREHVHERDSMCTDATLTWTSLCARASATCACIAGRRRCTFSLGTSTTLRNRSWCASTKCALTSTTLPSFSMFAPHPRACALLLAFGVSRCFTFEPLLCVQKEA